MKALFTTTFYLALIGAICAQPATFVFEGNNFRWHQLTNGTMFYDQDNGFAGLEVPIGENNHTIFASNLWIGGEEEGGILGVSFRQYCQNNDESCFNNWGPLKMDGSLATDQEVAQYNYIWFVTAEQIEEHISYFDCIANPDCNDQVEFPNYEIPEDILTWPGQSNDGSGFAEYLAPFFDRNADGNYSAEDGDHPIICGDFSSYAIWNDLGTESVEQTSSAIGIEVHTKVFGFNAMEGSEFNTLFVQHQMHHRGEEAINNTYVGSWTDFDIGNPIDDYLGTDVSRSMIYAYQGDPFDDGSSVGPGYGNDIPAMGIKFLGGPFADVNENDDMPLYESNYANETSGYNDGIVDNERLGLFSSMFHNNSSGPTATQDPTLPIHYYNYMRGIWRDGTPLSYGGIGFNPVDPDAIQARYVYLGISDPLLAGTNGIDPEYPLEGGWTEGNENNPPGDRRMIASSGPFTFAPGDVQYLDLAYIFARESHDENETVFETLERYADEVEGMECGPQEQIVVSTSNQTDLEDFIEIYPNPFTDQISISSGNQHLIAVRIFDLTGKLVRQISLNSNKTSIIDLNGLNPGLYILETENAQGAKSSHRIVKLK